MVVLTRAATKLKQNWVERRYPDLLGNEELTFMETGNQLTSLKSVQGTSQQDRSKSLIIASIAI